MSSQISPVTFKQNCRAYSSGGCVGIVSLFQDNETHRTSRFTFLVDIPSKHPKRDERYCLIQICPLHHLTPDDISTTIQTDKEAVYPFPCLRFNMQYQGKLCRI